MQYLYDQLKASKASGGPLAGVMPWSAVLSSQWDTDGYGIKLDTYKPGGATPAPGPAPAPATKAAAPGPKPAGGEAAAKPVETREEGGEQVEQVHGGGGGASGRRRLSWVQESLDSFRRAEVSVPS
jgi:hypothetical protein